MIAPSGRVSRGAFLLGALAATLGPLAALEAAPGDAHAAGLATSANLGPLINIPQTWNNCGPASIAEVLAYWGIARTQEQARLALRVDGTAVGMTPYGIPSYARGLGLRALMGVGGSEALVKGLIAGGFPVIVHQLVSLSDPVGHWRPIQAFDDRQGIFVASDPYLGPDHPIGYDDFASMWSQRGYAFVVLYPPARQARLSAILTASHWDRGAAYRRDLALLRAYQLDPSPAAAPASTSGAYRSLGLAWDAAYLGEATAARAYLGQAVKAGANPIEVRWVGTAIGHPS